MSFKLMDCAELIREVVNPKSLSVPIKYIGLEHINEQDLSLNSYGSSLDVDSGKYLFQKGDILFGKLRPYFRKAIIAQFDGVCSTDIWVIRPKAGQDLNFLFYWISSKEFVEYVNKASEGTRMPRAKWSIAAKLVKPECNSETTIGLILRNLDLKRFVNKDCNQTIESITQTIFKSWFVDFDPVRAKVVAKEKGEDPQLAAMLAISGKSAEELSGLSTENYQKLAATADLFPEELVETEHGEVPRGWEWKSVEDMLEINPRLSLKKNKMAKYTDMKALPTSGYSIGEFIYKEYKGGAKFQQGDVLLARIAPCLENGKTGIVDFLADNEVGFGSTEFIVLRKKNSIKTPFVACLARYESFVNHCIRNMVGTSGRQRVQNSCFQSFFVALPNNDILDTFNDKMEVLFANLTVNSEQSRSLAQIRDTLLPKLLSGELQITQ